MRDCEASQRRAISVRCRIFSIDTYDGQTAVSDDRGLHSPSPEVALAEAVRALPDMARDALPDGGQRDFIATVRDVTGQAIYTVTLSLTVRRAS